MRVFVLTDIHGNDELFRKALKSVGLKKSDKLFILGDIIDRGKDSKAVLDTILLLLEHNFDIKIIKGNHEQMLLDSLTDTAMFNQWMLNGGDKTLLSFLTNSIEKIPKKYIDLIRSFDDFIIYENFILVHAGLNMKIEDPFSDIYTMQWERNPENYINEEWLHNRKVIHGHTPKSMVEINYSISENSPIIGLDNGTYLKKEGYGNLTILELTNLKINFIK